MEDLSPRKAHARLLEDPLAVYVDVRTTPEFEQGHPAGAFNIPIFQPGGLGMMPNPDFLAVAEAVLDKQALLVVGCKAGPRSREACRLLEGAGFQRTVNVAGGFLGAADPMTGRIAIEGWAASGLPTATAPEAGRSYAELLAKRG